MKTAPYFACLLAIPLFTGVANADSNHLGVVAGYPALQSVIERSTVDYSSLQRYDAEIDALQERKTSVAAWDDPMMSLKLMNVPTDSFRLNQEPMTQKTVGFQQKIYGSGKLEQRGKVVEGKIGERVVAKVIEKNRLAREIAQNYFALASLQTEKRMIQETEALFRQLISVAQKKYAVGKGNQTNILEAEVQLSKLHDRLLSIDSAMETHRQNILRYTADTKGLTPATPDRLFYSKLVTGEEELVATVLKQNPDLALVEKMKNTTAEERELARLKSGSDYLVGLSYSQRDDLGATKRADFVGVEFSMTLPFFQNEARKAEVAEAASREIALEKHHLDLERKFLTTVKAQYAQIRRTEEQIDLYANGIIPQKTQSLQSAFSNYQTDRIDFLFLQMIEIELLRDKITLANLLFRHEGAVAELEELVAGPVEVKKHYITEVKP